MMSWRRCLSVAKISIVRRQFSQKLDVSRVSLVGNSVDINWPEIPAPPGTTVKCYRFEHFPLTNEYYSTISVIRNWVKVDNIETGKLFHFQITPVFANENVSEPYYTGNFQIPEKVISILDSNWITYF